MAQQNGAAGMNANAAAMYTNGSVMPSAGHYADMQTLMQHMETLSGWLQQNREEWAGLQEGLARVERQQMQQQQHDRAHLPNGDSDASPHPLDDPSVPTITSLQSALSAANRRLGALEQQAREHEKLQTLYESTLSDATERIRQYCFEQQNHIIALHQHYTALLQTAREETLEAQLVHQRWQEGLGRLSGLVREAYKDRAEEKRPWIRKLGALREENRVLRKMVGWDEVTWDSEDEEEDGGQEQSGLELSAVRDRGGSGERVGEGRRAEGGGAGGGGAAAAGGGGDGRLHIQ